jgi:hypothetical protein
MIKNWKEYNEAVGGFEIPLKQIGPNYGEQELQNTITKSDTTLIKGSNGRMYFQSDFLDLYNLSSLRIVFLTSFNVLYLILIVSFGFLSI